MNILKSIYTVVRSIIITVIVLLVIVYAGLYVLLSVPSFQNKVKTKVCDEVSTLLGGPLSMESLTLRPFSEVILKGVRLDSPEGTRCASIGKVAAGIDLWTLFTDRKIVLNYAEIIGMDITVTQDTAGAPTNIQFLIDALSPKEKKNPPTLFDLKIRNIVVRSSKASFSRRWMIDSKGSKLPFADMNVDNLRMDLSIPILKNDQYRFNVRNMQFEVTPSISVKSLVADVEFIKDSIGGDDQLKISKFNISFPSTSLNIGDLDLRLGHLSDINAQVAGTLTPSDFSGLLPELDVFRSPWEMKIEALYGDTGIEVSEFEISNKDSNSLISFNGGVQNINKKDSLDINISGLHAELSEKIISDSGDLISNMTDKLKRILHSVGRVSLDFEGFLTKGDIANGKGVISTDNGSLEFNADGKRLKSSRPQLKLIAKAEDIELGKILATDKVGNISMDLEADLTGINKNADGTISLTSDNMEVIGNKFSDIDLEIRKNKDEVSLNFLGLADELEINVNGNALLAGKSTHLQTEVSFANLIPSRFGLKGRLADSNVSAAVRATTKGNSADNLAGNFSVSDFRMERKDGQTLSLKELSIGVDSIKSSVEKSYNFGREITLTSDWIDAKILGDINPSTIAQDINHILFSIFPTLLPNSSKLGDSAPLNNDFSFDINIKGVSEPYLFFNTPVSPLANIPVKGLVNTKQGKIDFEFSTPHLQQGKNKLIRDAGISLSIDSYIGMAKMSGGLIFPAKKGDVELATDIYARHDEVNLNLGLNPTLQSAIKGGVALMASFSRIPSPYRREGELAVNVNILPSTITVSGMPWSIADGSIDYSGKRISVNNFLISHQGQYVKIDGVASENPYDELKVRLNDIDLEYIFNILNINYVSFGGMATGEVIGNRLLTKNLDARTEYLRVKNLSYNGAVLGDGDLASEYDISQQKVGIYGVIRDPLTRELRASVDGGVWVTRDSLSFGFDANKVNVGIMKPFVSAFCSDLNGIASGKCKLYGTFSDIDLVGALKADTLSMKLDFTNTWYHAGNDSVYLRKGIIDIPPLTLYDDEGHTAELSGWIRHTYFHEPVFNFKLKDARSLLCYDTNEKINPLWYGTIYGSGHAQINGFPGQIDIDMNMTTDEGSKFYYIISEAEDVDQYSFLTFTDRRKARKVAERVDSIPEYLLKFQKQKEEMDAGSSNVILSLKGTVTNDALVTLVMDPKAGDKIIARGQGALQMDYNLASNDLRMIGTYVLDEGNYNFTLQDIIIKNFNIKRGSLIKFDGDPMNAILDITATYRVNTNLTDLDKSFATDKELNRTNVPVDAVLLVDGPMTHPDITFDIELPSLTSDVERKVKSIVSTNDMMSRQIIYLLALNRFYTPEYTGGESSNGAEWSSMASSTISSQLSNILSQMTDKLDVAPSFRSDKGDFTDMEFDLALSSRLLNNRLLINGNFGYRDKTTSNTQFVGDFDIEYLLSKNGNLRLKAYNHFNDQNYYLRSALTTQGVGVVFQRDFDRLFRRKKENAKREKEEDNDSTENDMMPYMREAIEIRNDSINQNK